MKGTPPDAGVPGEDASVVVSHEWAIMFFGCNPAGQAWSCQVQIGSLGHETRDTLGAKGRGL
jgi:hypothetical protein